MKYLATRYEKSFYIDALIECSNVISNSFVIFDITGELHSDLMQQAISHAFTNSCFHFRYTMQKDQLYKECIPGTVDIPVIDFSQQSNPEHAFQVQLEEYYYNKLSLEHGLLFRGCLCKMASNHFRAIVMAHHICLDGTGFQLFFSHITKAYQELRQGNTLVPVLADSPLEQVPALSALMTSEALTLWSNAFNGRPARTDFNHAINPEIRSATGETLAFGSTLSQQVKLFCRRRGLTPNLLFKGLYALLISRIANQNVVATSSPMDRRTGSMRQKMGCFVNTRLDIFDFSRVNTLDEYWSQMKQFTRDTKLYSELPYAELVHHLQQQHENSEAMLTNVAFGSTVGIGDVYPLDEHCQIQQDYSFLELNSDLQLLYCESSGSSFNFRFNYLQSFQESGLFTHFLERFRNLIEWAISQNDGYISHLPFLSEQELLRLTQHDLQPYPDQSLAQLVHHWVQTTPSAVALIDSDNNHTINYRQLHEKVSLVVHYLSGLKYRSDTGQPCVVINLESLVDTVIIILATQYKGFAFTCVDASAPEARKQTVMEQISPLVLIGDAIPSFQGMNSHHLPSLTELTGYSELAVPASLAPHFISQFIFTSGTTGQPKAVALSQRALVSTLYNSRVIPVGERLLYSANEAFDAASLQLWLALIHGRTLVIPKRNSIADPDAMAYLLRTHKVDHLFLTTGLFETYMASSRREMFNNLDTVVFGGDCVSKQAVAKGLGCNIKNLINIYGPTETSIYVTAHRCTEQDLTASTIPVGKSRPNSQTWVVDDQDRLLGTGMVGHIVISGDGLAEGYLGQSLQNDKFCHIHLPDPISGTATRVYRTGDYGYWREDGTLVFCGRRDSQIKLRGYRIELGEIRQILEQIAGVNMAVVVLSKKTKHKQLLGYYQAEQALDHLDIYQQLQHRLPAYMIPSQLIYMEKFPLNRNGKLDRRALPEPELAVSETRNLTRLEQMLLSQAATVLELESLSLNDDFVAQGGDSISAIMFSVGLEEQGVRLTISDIMKYRCFADMAQRASFNESAQIIPGEKTGSVDLLPAQRWFFEQNFASPAHFNQAVTLKFPHNIDPIRLESALTDLTQYHDSFWLRFDETLQQFFSESTQPHVELHTLDATVWSDVEHHIATLNASFDFHHGPLCKALLFTVESENSPYLYICAHHLIVDGVSWRRIVADLQDYYEQGGEFRPLPYSNTQCYRTQWDALQPDLRELDHWLSLPATLPVSKVREQNQMVQRQQISFSPQQTLALLGPANQPYRTKSNELLLAVLYCILGHQKHGLSILIEGHGRKEFSAMVRSEATVGWFTSIFPVSLPPYLGGWPALIKLAKQALRSLPHQGENYLFLAYHHPESAIKQRLQTMLKLPVAFNFLGRFAHGNEKDWCIEHRFTHHLVSDSNKPLRELDINAWVSGDQLCVDVEMAGVEYSGMTLTEFCSRFHSTLEALLEHCGDPDCFGGLTSCDLADIVLGQETIEQLEHRVGPLDTIYPATTFQRELLYFNRINGDYQIDQLFFRLEGELNLQAFTDAWTRALSKYDMLRAGFDDTFTPGQPLALIPRQATLPLHVVNWEDLDCESLFQQCIVSERQRPFDWHQPPLLRLMLARTSATSHLLLFTFHHVLFDGWSMQIFLKEIMQDYERLIKGDVPDIQQSSFAAFPRWLSTQDSSSAHHFWTQYLAGASMNMRIIPDCNGGESGGLRIQPVKCGLDKDAGERLREFAVSSGATLNQLCQIAWAITLARYTDNPDVVFGTTLTKRPGDISKVTELVGLFVATPPLRIRTEGDISMLVQQLNADSEQRTEYAFCDLNHYDEHWRPTAPFGTLFVFENYPEQKHQDDYSLQYYHMGTVSGTNHQIVLCQFPDEEMHFSLFYDSTELSTGLASRIADDYRSVLLALPCIRQVTELLSHQS